ncbi:NAD(P)/FAD-dependent oxidoreductase [Fulvimarina endophytica]|uniref:NAD(P)/FAD-dependent oxidoreductase n=1 Tax=Fulvimarina endophytica TaxID=2293836 RepID=A0A371X9X0_9HYPH|nr:NAD(P)/FAD-dependent oxidoreductase [Fulvimarina endophytica]RFC66020.1 NAD(P)/FAD-dependent oxidoreductase [Fulvimarina endophytica]
MPDPSDDHDRNEVPRVPGAGRAPTASIDLDVIVIGAGLSGICAGHYLQEKCPELRYAILEGRERMGGTWDLFRYPGIRSDSDLYTFGFSFRPWTEDKSIADGASILNYLKETARDEGIENKIRFGHRVVAAYWNSRTARWQVEVESGEERRRSVLTCRFLFACSGYYDYATGYKPEIPGLDTFAGPVIHPQHWPADLDYAGKRVVVVGSGATAVTLVPAMAQTADKVVMLQRSPSYIVSLPAKDRTALALKKRLPANLAHRLARWKNILVSMGFYQFARRRPQKMKEFVISRVRRQLGRDYDVEKHFTPRYDPWDQRLCLVPNGDLFKAIRSGRAEVVTGTIRQVSERGIDLADGTRIEADIVVTATGLKLQMLGGARLSIDGVPVDPGEAFMYRGMMLSDVPNFAISIGYTNASWTLKCELTALYVTRLLQRLDARGDDWCMPKRQSDMGEAPLIDFSSGYIERSRDLLPRQGEHRPWRLHQNYILDYLTLGWGRTDDAAMRFGRRDEDGRKAA